MIRKTARRLKDAYDSNVGIGASVGAEINSDARAIRVARSLYRKTTWGPRKVANAVVAARRKAGDISEAEADRLRISIEASLLTDDEAESEDEAAAE